MPRSHYELAFEAYLSRRGMAFVSVESMRRVVPGNPGLKVFDYVVYPVDGPNYLVEVKGRKQVRHAKQRQESYECWVTRGDLSGLDEWRQVFGDQFEPAFAFAYWRVGETTCDGDGVVLAGRAYAFRVVRLDDYAAHQRRRSPRWGTLTLSTADFRRLAKPPDVLWPTE